MKHPYALMAITAILASCAKPHEPHEPIDRQALVLRNNPHITSPDTLSSLTVGNGEFAFTTDVTGLQTFPSEYSLGIPLGTMSQWAWHSFPNVNNYKPAEALADYDFGRGRKEPYSIQFKEDGRQKDAANYLRVNPHRLHLGCIGLALPDSATLADVTDISQDLNLWTGTITSHFLNFGTTYDVTTLCHPDRDIVATAISANGRNAAITIRFPYPTGAHADDACRWDDEPDHFTDLVAESSNGVVLRRVLDNDTVYHVTIRWEGKDVHIDRAGANKFFINSEDGNLKISALFAKAHASEADITTIPTFDDVQVASQQKWQNFWTSGAAVDFSHCTDSRAPELERRVVLSQYLLATQCAGTTPPQETGLTYNSWFGKFHLEMIWWHQSWLPLWGHPEMLARTMPWYQSVQPIARQIAQRQGFDGIRWMKMTDPSGQEAPSRTGSFLIWQQPHFIYLAELLRRSSQDSAVLNQYYDLVQQTAEFMASFATRDSARHRYTLQGAIPAQETLRAAETVNPPFELSYWHFALSTAQSWRELRGQQRVALWDSIISQLSPLAYNEDGLYLAAETATDTYRDARFTSDHMAVLGAVGILPNNSLIREDYMKRTFDWIWNNWTWDKTWGWDYPMTAMNATRLGEPAKAIDALFMGKQKNTYLPNGHNFQDARLRCYLPGNGGLLTAIALMCAGWDGCKTHNPGFPTDGSWDVRWEGLKPLP